MEKFIYVFTTKDRDEFEKAGLKAIKSDKWNNIFIFVAEDVEDAGINLDGVIYIRSDVLTY